MTKRSAALTRARRALCDGALALELSTGETRAGGTQVLPLGDDLTGRLDQTALDCAAALVGLDGRGAGVKGETLRFLVFTALELPLPGGVHDRLMFATETAATSGSQAGGRHVTELRGVLLRQPRLPLPAENVVDPTEEYLANQTLVGSSAFTPETSL